MKILLTNDDGYFAKGIKVLFEYLLKSGHDVLMVAPALEQSAKSSSITLSKPISVVNVKDNVYSVSGTPVDCVIIAKELLMKESFDLVISGINGGQNIGQDVLYSGTVGAALEAMNLGFKAIAISLTSFSNQIFETAAKGLIKLLENNFLASINVGEVININVPNLEYKDIKGFKITKLGSRHFKDFVMEINGPRDKSMYWIGGGKVIWKEEKGTDYDAVSNGYISITPIRPNFTIKSRMEDLKLFGMDNEK